MPENLKRAANKRNDFCAFAEMKLSREGREAGEGNFSLTFQRHGFSASYIESELMVIKMNYFTPQNTANKRTSTMSGGICDCRNKKAILNLPRSANRIVAW
jgi:hypothetical protein